MNQRVLIEKLSSDTDQKRCSRKNVWLLPGTDRSAAVPGGPFGLWIGAPDFYAELPVERWKGFGTDACA